jgi:hypothetical protein
MISLAAHLGLGKEALECTKESYRQYDGGNFWAQYVSFLSFFRHKTKLDIDYSKWACYERLAEISGPRYVHEEFCIISDRPTKLEMDGSNGHCTDGPYIEWSDGSGIYALDGVRIPQYIIDLINKEGSAEEILAIENAEHRLVAIKYYGVHNMLPELGGKVINTYKDYKLHSVTIDGDEERLLEMQNPSEEKKHFEFVPPDINTCQEAMAWRVGFKLYSEPKTYS